MTGAAIFNNKAEYTMNQNQITHQIVQRAQRRRSARLVPALFFALMLTALLVAGVSATPARQSSGEVIRLPADFVPNPYQLTVTVGGSHQATDIGADCDGYVGLEPTLTIDYTPASMPWLRFIVRSPADTMLLVQDPTDSFYCSDDWNNSINPLVDIKNQKKGTYYIWVGTKDGETANATLGIAEGNYLWSSLRPPPETSTTTSGMRKPFYWRRILPE
jgi:hypothetical protein